MDVYEALRSRFSARAFRPDPVPRAALEQMLRHAGQAPSGSNTQPWRVWVLQGARLAALRAAVMARRAGLEPVEVERPYNYYPVRWRDPYLARRRACGWGLYGLLGIEKGDKSAMKAQHDRNFVFFDAPVGLFFTIDADLEQGSWLDYGMFLQSLMLAARQEGLHTCPQAAWLNHHDVVRAHLPMRDDEALVCGMSLGYLDEAEAVNRFRPERVAFEDYVTFVED